MKAKIYILLVMLLPVINDLSGQGIIIQPGALVAVAGGGKIYLTGTATMTIKSTSAGTGTLLVDNAAGSTVSLPANGAKVERYLTTDTWHYISSPVSNALSGTFLNDYLMTSDPSSATGWSSYITSTTAPLVVMRGYAVWKPSSNVTPESFTGNLNNGSLSLSLARNPADPWAGWNLAGNPYPSPIDLGSAGVSWNQVEHAAWFWNGTAGNYQATVTMSGIWPYNGGLHSTIVPAMQGFYVHVADTYTGTTSLGFDNSVRVTSTQAFLKSTQNPLMVIKAQGYANGYFDLVSVQFNPDATASYDPGFDAYKLSGLTEAPQLYTKIGDTNVSCNSLPFTSSHITIPMGFSCGISGNYTLIADSLRTFESGIGIRLEDLKQSTTQDLRTNPVYNFSYDVSDTPNRFLLHFDNPVFGTREQTQEQPLRIYSSGSLIYLRKTGTDALNGTITVYDPLGRELFSGIVEDSPLLKFDLNLNTGYYLVRVITADNLYSQKVLITR
jgi:hypothetical protein